MNRRNFLQAMLAAAAAPAICHAENLMKIYVPSQDLVRKFGSGSMTLDGHIPLYDIGPGDFTIDGWTRVDGSIQYLAISQTTENGAIRQVEYLDGLRVDAGTLDKLGAYSARPGTPVELDGRMYKLDRGFALLNGWDVTLTSVVRPKEDILRRATQYPVIPSRAMLKI